MSTHIATAEAASQDSIARAREMSAVAIAGVAAALLTVWTVWSSPLMANSHATALAKGLLVACYVGVGVLTWSQRPSSRVGPLIAGAGLLYAGTALAAVDRPLPHTVGRLALAAAVVYFVYLFVSLPRSRPTGRLERGFVAATVVLSVAMWAVALVFADTLAQGGPLTDCTTRCPDNAFQLVETPHAVTTAINFTGNALTALIALGLIVVLARKARSKTLIRRRIVGPLMYATMIFAATYATYSLVSEASSTPPSTGLRVLGTIGAFAVPLALLVAQVRGRLFAAASVWRAVNRAETERVTPERMQKFVGITLDDPSFELALWSEKRSGYVDVHGSPVELPHAHEARSATLIMRNGIPSLALIHDPALDDDPQIVRGLGTAAATLLENTMLVDELRTSQARLVESAEQERHRLERDLHDVAQQRLTAIQLKLELAREQAPTPELEGELEELATETAKAAAELRALAHGLYPSLLYDAGLAPALRSFASWPTILVRIIDRGIGRASAGTELAIYFCALEALQNVAKHAGPGASATVRLERVDDSIEFEVRDDGVGFDPAAEKDGVGLVNMRDRLTAVGGKLEIRSFPGAGATVHGSVPVVPGANEPRR